MTLTFDPGSDLAVTDNLAPVTWRQAGGVTEQTVSALRVPVKQTDPVASCGVVRRIETTFHLSSADLGPGVMPGPGDELTEADGTRWTVDRAVWAMLGTRWRLSCSRLDWAELLTDRVRIERADTTRDSAGGIARTWLPIAVDVMARVQPRSAPIDDGHGTLARVEQVEVLLAEPIEVAREDRIVTASNQVYLITDLRDPGRPGEPFVLLAESSPWPTS